MKFVIRTPKQIHIHDIDWKLPSHIFHFEWEALRPGCYQPARGKPCSTISTIQLTWRRQTDWQIDHISQERFFLSFFFHRFFFKTGFSPKRGTRKKLGFICPFWLGQKTRERCFFFDFCGFFFVGGKEGFGPNTHNNLPNQPFAAPYSFAPHFAGSSPGPFSLPPNVQLFKKAPSVVAAMGWDGHDSCKCW